MTEQIIQPLQLKNLIFKDVRFSGIALNKKPNSSERNYYVSITESISRILTTRLGERVMRPDFGSNLYLLRDRDFNSAWRIKATRYIFESLKRWEPRVIFKRLHFNIDALTGKHTFYLELEPNA